MKKIIKNIIHQKLANKKSVFLLKKYTIISLITVIIICFILIFISNNQNTNLDYLQNRLHNLNYRIFRNKIPKIRSNENIETIKINFSNEDIRHFENLYQKYEHPEYGFYSENPQKNYGIDFYTKNNKRIGTEIIFNNKKFRAKVKSHGKQPDLHYQNGFLSLNIKLENDINELIQKKFKLIIYERINYRRYYDEIIELSDNFGLERYPTNLFNLKIEGKPDHLYYLENVLNEKTIDKIFPNKNFLFIKNLKGNIIINEHNKTQENALKKLKESQDSIVHEKILKLNKYLEEKDHEKLISLFDFNYMANFEAFRIIGGFTGHGYDGENLEIFYNKSDGRFYPIIHRDFYFGRIDTCNISLDCLKKYRWDGGGNYGVELSQYKTISNHKKLRKEALKRVEYFFSNA